MVPLNGHCDILEFDDVDPKHFHDDSVLELNPQETRRLLKEYFDEIAGKDPALEAILVRLAEINPSIASKFVLKSSILPQLRFRLITDAPSGRAVDTFTALSYSCGVQRDRKIEIHDQQPDPIFRLPTSGVLSKAIVQEVDQQSEGIWCDQLCIGQTDAAEKAVSIGLMEGIYRSSRLVVIALDDIEVGHDECNFLEEYGEEFAEAQGKAELEARMRGDEPDGGVLTNLNEYAHPQYLLSNRAFGSLYHKIIDSDWNNRAWCPHEARLSQDIVVLMRCAGQSAKVLRLSPKFFSHMMHLGLQLDDANNNKTSTLLESGLPSAMHLTAFEA